MNLQVNDIEAGSRSVNDGQLGMLKGAPIVGANHSDVGLGDNAFQSLRGNLLENGTLILSGTGRDIVTGAYKNPIFSPATISKVGIASIDSSLIDTDSLSILKLTKEDLAKVGVYALIVPTPDHRGNIRYDLTQSANLKFGFDAKGRVMIAEGEKTIVNFNDDIYLTFIYGVDRERHVPGATIGICSHIPRDQAHKIEAIEMGTAFVVDPAALKERRGVILYRSESAMSAQPATLTQDGQLEFGRSDDPEKAKTPVWVYNVTTGGIEVHAHSQQDPAQKMFYSLKANVNESPIIIPEPSARIPLSAGLKDQFALAAGREENAAEIMAITGIILHSRDPKKNIRASLSAMVAKGQVAIDGREVTATIDGQSTTYVMTELRVKSGEGFDATTADVYCFEKSDCPDVLKNAPLMVSRFDDLDLVTAVKSGKDWSKS